MEWEFWMWKDLWSCPVLIVYQWRRSDERICFDCYQRDEWEPFWDCRENTDWELGNLTLGYNSASR